MSLFLCVYFLYVAVVVDSHAIIGDKAEVQVVAGTLCQWRHHLRPQSSIITRMSLPIQSNAEHSTTRRTPHGAVFVATCVSSCPHPCLTTNLFSTSMIRSLEGRGINRNIHCETVWDWLLSWNVILRGFMQAVPLYG